ncbi:MAG TPA: ester cyclase [Acidimicrobiia bacterium]|nr:ester cyclase [Acidimicrobiia bacterium]
MTTTTFPPFIDMTAKQFQAHLDQRSVNTHDPAAVAQWFSDDAVQRAVATGETARGREAIQERMAKFFQALPDVYLEVRDLFAAGDRMCVQVTMTGTHEGDLAGLPPTGRRIEAEWCLVFRFGDDGLVEEELLYSDLATILSQLGALPG